jgi:hypothetical protein
LRGESEGIHDPADGEDATGQQKQDAGSDLAQVEAVRAEDAEEEVKSRGVVSLLLFRVGG